MASCCCFSRKTNIEAKRLLRESAEKTNSTRKFRWKYGIKTKREFFPHSSLRRNSVDFFFPGCSSTALQLSSISRWQKKNMLANVLMLCAFISCASIWLAGSEWMNEWMADERRRNVLRHGRSSGWALTRRYTNFVHFYQSKHSIWLTCNCKCWSCVYKRTASVLFRPTVRFCPIFPCRIHFMCVEIEWESNPLRYI